MQDRNELGWNQIGRRGDWVVFRRSSEITVVVMILETVLKGIMCVLFSEPDAKFWS